jgi:hypothetical protein
MLTHAPNPALGSTKHVGHHGCIVARVTRIDAVGKAWV